MTTPTRRPRAGLIAAAIALAAVAAVPLLPGLHEGSAQATAPASVPPPPPVSVATVAATEVDGWQELSGRLEAIERVDVRSRAAGTVQSVHFREGSLVRQGDLLFTIDPAPYAAEVQRADAQVVAARSRLAHARSEQERSLRLWEERAIAQRELDERNHALAEADAGLRAAEAALQTARLNLGYTQVRAPIAGRIGRIEVTAGNLVAAGPGAPVLTTLVSVHPIYASFDADEQLVARALAGLPGGSGAREQLSRIPVRMGTAGQAEFAHEGRLQLVDNQVDARSGTIRVRAVFDNRDGALIPGQFARLRLGQATRTPALLVNERAVGTDQDKRFVIVVGPDNKASWREVRLGAAVDGLRIVTQGLQAGERIVVNGLQRVRPGSLVAPREVAMDAKPEVTARRDGAPQS
ncbi:efflux RND transporter periplasmic adaptor subunit [Azohydromonas caseinilytica]|uniref:Efflux RND transporter periplasmic adaptor subunit n=1 Tax=Azohydromonas caseinilytica TaxID=2728836 RepID=A0A848FHT6_9BURK|nr:efflux RND transporter periplasmic adaptor subunit [Azohydromonas caseinilytica]NML17823.1 efflux RND transporter periplasmic adaptor subunit [Azohydromonas caseinilytica]